MPNRFTSRATAAQLREALEALELDSRGKKDTLLKRLNGAIKRSEVANMSSENGSYKPASKPTMAQPLDAFLCFDVEATCVADKLIDWPNEIIEFPVILLGWADETDEDMIEGMITPEAEEPSTPNEISSMPRETQSGSNDLPADNITVRDTKVREVDDEPSEREESKGEDMKRIETRATEQAADASLPPQLNAGKSASSAPKEILDPKEQLDHQERGKSLGRTLVVKDKFHSYVQPMWQPKLTKFCTGLTGIKQETIDQSPTFPEMIKLFEKWLEQHGLLVDGKLRDKACWCTDGTIALGSAGLSSQVPKQLHITPLKPDPYPAYLRGPVLNVKDAVNYVLSDLWYTNELEKAAIMEARYRATLEETRRKADEARQKAIKIPSDTQMSTTIRPPPPESQVQKRLRQRPRLCTTGSWALSLKGMKMPKFYLTITGQLAALDLGEFQGQQHSGIDDAMNIARVLIELARRNVLLDVNEKPFQPQRFNWMGKPGQVFWNSKIVLE